MVSQVRDRCNMCAGGCREPRRKGTRVAAPSGCVVPWAARASCWPQPQQLLPVSAAGSGRRCCTGAFPRRTIRRVVVVRIHPCSPFSRQIKQKLQYPVRILESLVEITGIEPVTSCMPCKRSPEPRTHAPPRKGARMDDIWRYNALFRERHILTQKQRCCLNEFH